MLRARPDHRRGCGGPKWRVRHLEWGYIAGVSNNLLLKAHQDGIQRSLDQIDDVCSLRQSQNPSLKI